MKDVDQKKFNSFAFHPLQSFEWGEFRKKTGIKVIRKIVDREETKSSFQLTIHQIPHTPWQIGYLPKGQLPTREMILTLKKIGREENCVFIQLEPTLENGKWKMPSTRAQAEGENGKLGLRPSFHPLFTKYTFVLDLTKDDEELLRNMHPKTRYNIKVAQKHGVRVFEDNSDEAFAQYLKLTKETIKRQKFYAHDEKYHRLMWETLRCAQGKLPKEELTAHLLLAKYKPKTNDQGLKTLVAWILFVFKDTLYYPYGASSSEYREVMASNLMMWEAIRFGKKLGLKKFDLWGSLGPNPNTNDPWYGFHRFKEGYGPKLVEFVGSYDLIINPFLYQLYKAADQIRWSYLKLKKIILEEAIIKSNK